MASAGAGPFILGRGGEYLRAGGLDVGTFESIAKLPGQIDISGSYYFTGGGIGWDRGGMYPGLLVATNKPRHLFTGAGAVYWTDDRSVLKAFTCTQ